MPPEITTDLASRPPRDNLVRGVYPGVEVRAAATTAETSDPAVKEVTTIGTLFGHFSVFDVWTEIDSYWEGNFLERIAPGAFKKTFSENARQIRALYEHGMDPQLGNKPLGPIQVLSEDPVGGYYEVGLIDTSYNRDLKPGLEAGLYGASFRFRVMKEELVQEPTASEYNPKGLPERTIKEIQLFELGPVTFGQYPEATAGMRAVVRSLTDSYILSRVDGPAQMAKRTTQREEQSAVAKLSTVSTDTPDTAPEALSETGAEATHSESGSRELEGDPVAPSAAPETTAAPAEEARSEMPIMDETRRSLDEVKARQDEIKARLSEIHYEVGTAVMTDGQRTEWNSLTEERKRNEAAISEHEARAMVVQAFGTQAPADEPRHPERSAQPPQDRSEPAVAPTRMRTSIERVPANPFAVEEYRNLSGSVDELRTAYRAGAGRVIEGSTLAHPNVDEARAKAALIRLLGTKDEDSILAKRILTTGSPIYQRAFGKSLKQMPLTADEQRALSLGSDADGGFAVPFQLDPSIILTSDGQTNPLREISRVERIVGKEWQGVTSDGVQASYAGEADPTTDNSPTLEQPTVRTLRAQAFIPFSIEISQDWSGLQSEMAVLLQDAKDNLEADKFFNGTGTTVPNGVIGTLDAGSVVTTITNDAFAVGDIYKLEDALPSRFKSHATFVANKAIYNKTRQFDTQGGASLWVRLLDGNPSELIGYPAREASEMDSTIADAKKILLLGDFRHFLIVDRVGMSLELIPHLFDQATGYPTGQRGIFAFWRNNTVILSDNAFRLLKVF